MDILLSGQAATVAIFGNNNNVALHSIDGTSVNDVSRGHVGAVFAGCNDLSIRKVADTSEAQACLRHAWAKDRSLRLLLLLIDDGEPAEDLFDYSECLEDLIRSHPLDDFLRHSMYIAPLNNIAPMERIRPALKNTARVEQLINEILEDQLLIRRVRDAFESVPAKAFLDQESRNRFVSAMADTGASYELVKALKEGKKVDFIVLKLLAQLRHIDSAREIINEWTAGMRSSRIPKQKIEAEVEDDPIFDEPKRTGQAGWRVFEDVKRQQAEIIARLKKRDLDSARVFASELVERQRSNSTYEQISKSLSKLSHKAKELGVPELQLEWAEQAVRENPADPVSFQHLADALIGVNDFARATDIIDQIEKLGSKLTAENGRARILRATGKLEQARAKFLSAAKEFANDPNSWFVYVGAAEVLRDMGRHEESLAEYRAIHEMFPLEERTLAGVASVLMDLGRFDEAISTFNQAAKRRSEDTVADNGRATVYKLAGNFSKALELYDEILRKYPNDGVALCGRAEVFRVSGQLNKALEAYKIATERSPYNPVAFSGTAEVLKELGRFSDARDILSHATRRFPYDWHLVASYAGVLKSQGLYQEALVSYDKAIAGAPFNFETRAARADLFRRLHQWESALAAYEQIIAERPHYAPAQLAKASVCIRLHRFDEAETLLPIIRKPASQLDWSRYFLRAMLLEERGHIRWAQQALSSGIKRAPFARQRRLMSAALARSKLRAGHASDALRVVSYSENEVSNVIKFHALAASGMRERAHEAFKAISENEALAPYIDLTREIAKRFRLLDDQPMQSREWIFTRETEVLLVEAA